MQVTIVTEGDPGRMSGGFLYHRRVADLAGAHDATVRFVSVPRRPFPLAMVDGPAVMRAAVAGADVVVVDSLASNTLGPWLAAGLGRGAPIVGSIHQDLGGIDVGRVRRVVQTRFDRAAWKRASHLIVASELLADELVAGGVRRDAMTVVPPGRDVPGAGSPAPDGTPAGLRDGRSAALLCVGNWLDRKGIVEVLEALAQLPERSATLHLVGDEDVDPAYRRRVLDRLGRPDLAGRVVRHGIVDPDRMCGLYAAADAFVLASTVEPYGTVYGEAMSAGLPVIGWAAGNLPHLADDGVEGRIVPTGDIAGLAAALTAVATDEELRARLGAAAQSRAAGLPTWAETAGSFFAVCRRAATAR